MRLRRDARPAAARGRGEGLGRAAQAAERNNQIFRAASRKTPRLAGKQDSDYESDCSDESGPPGLDCGGGDDDDDGPPGLEEDGNAPPGGSAGGSAGGSDSEDYDSDDSDDSGPPGLEDEEERERAERAARKKAAAPAPAPAPPLSKSQAKAAKAKRQKVRARRPVSNSRLAAMGRWRGCTYAIELLSHADAEAGGVC